MKRGQRILSFVLVLGLCVSLLPVSTMALDLPELDILENVVEAVKAEENTVEDETREAEDKTEIESDEDAEDSSIHTEDELIIDPEDSAEDIIIQEEAPVLGGAAPTIGKEQVMKNINELYSLLGGKFFTSNGSACSHSTKTTCNNCNANYIIKNSTWFNNTVTKQPSSLSMSHYSYSSSLTNGWTCAGFANFAGEPRKFCVNDKE